MEMNEKERDVIAILEEKGYKVMVKTRDNGPEMAIIDPKNKICKGIISRNRYPKSRFMEGEYKLYLEDKSLMTFKDIDSLVEFMISKE